MSELSRMFPQYAGPMMGATIVVPESGDVLPVVLTDQNEIQFRIQEGPVKETGVNGCQIDAVIKFARDFIAWHNKRFACRENARALTKLDEAMHWLQARTDRRTAEQIEGTNAETREV